MWPHRIFGGSVLSGFSVGILTINTNHPLLPGNVQNAQSFPTPVLYQEVHVSDVHALMRGDASLVDPIVAAAERLAEKGVRAIAGACGSFAFYQKSVAEVVGVPVFLSIMLQVPFLQKALGARKKLCIVCAAESSIDNRVFEQCDITDASNLVVREMKGHAEFDRMLHNMDTLDPWKLRDEVVAVCNKAIEDDPAI